MSVIGGPNIVEDGLVLSLDAANTKSYPGSGTTWKDLSGNGNNGTLTNGPTFDSGNLGSIVFDGVDDRVDISFISSSFSGNIPFTATVWVYPTQFTDNFDCVLGVNTSAGGNRFLLGFSNTGQLLTNRTDVNALSNAGRVLLNNWYLISFSYQTNGSVIVFLNDIHLTEITNTTTVTFASNDTWNLGAEYDTAVLGDFFTGNISQFQLYNQALTAAEILQNYNATKGRFGL